MDSFLNKHYLSQMKKQDLIRQEKIILDIIEKFDNKKAFNMLKEEYLREKLKITKGYYLNKGKKKKDYYTNLVNLENYKEKLITENKSNNSDGDFLFSLMDCLGCRPKKVMVKKINKKIEFLSISIIPAGVAGRKAGRLIAIRPVLIGWKPSTSLR